MSRAVTPISAGLAVKVSGPAFGFAFEVFDDPTDHAKAQNCFITDEFESLRGEIGELCRQPLDSAFAAASALGFF